MKMRSAESIGEMIRSRRERSDQPFESHLARSTDGGAA